MTNNITRLVAVGMLYAGLAMGCTDVNRPFTGNYDFSKDGVDFEFSSMVNGGDAYVVLCEKNLSSKGNSILERRTLRLNHLWEGYERVGGDGYFLNGQGRKCTFQYYTPIDSEAFKNDEGGK